MYLAFKIFTRLFRGSLRGFINSSFPHAVAGAVLIFSLTGCGNVLEDFPNKTSNQYLTDQARKFIDENNYSAAIQAIAPVLESEPDNAEVVYLASVAYAGRAGLRILDLFQSIIDGVASKSILEIFAEHYRAANLSNIDDIEHSVAILEKYGLRAQNRNSDMNFFAIFLYYSRIGINLNYYAYDSTTNNKQSNFTACHTVTDFAAASTGFPDTTASILYLTIPRIVDTMTYIAATGAGFDDIKNATAVLPAGLNYNTAPCVATPNNVGCLGVRSAINVGKSAGGIGLGTGGAGAVCNAVTP